MSDRRTFLKQAGILAAGLPLTAGLHNVASATPQPSLPGDKWAQLRQLFDHMNEVRVVEEEICQREIVLAEMTSAAKKNQG